jgi:hypothetical protein
MFPADLTSRVRAAVAKLQLNENYDPTSFIEAKVNSFKGMVRKRFMLTVVLASVDFVELGLFDLSRLQLTRYTLKHSIVHLRSSNTRDCQHMTVEVNGFSESGSEVSSTVSVIDPRDAFVATWLVENIAKVFSGRLPLEWRTVGSIFSLIAILSRMFESAAQMEFLRKVLARVEGVDGIRLANKISGMIQDLLTMKVVESEGSGYKADLGMSAHFAAQLDRSTAVILSKYGEYMSKPVDDVSEDSDRFSEFSWFEPSTGPEEDTQAGLEKRLIKWKDIKDVLLSN